MISKEEYLRNNKQDIYEVYRRIVKKVEDYSTIKRSQMLDAIMASLENNYKLLNSLIDEDELINIHKYIEGDKNVIFEFYLLGHNNKYNNFIYEGYVPFIKKAYEYYINNKKEYYRTREKEFYALGLILTYGSLTNKNFGILFNNQYPNDNYKDYLNSPFLRFYTFSNNKSTTLLEIEPLRNKILSLHSNNIKLKTSKEEIINRGKNIISKNTKLYNKIENNKNLNKFLKFNFFKIEFACFAGFNNFDSFLHEFSYDLDDASDEEIDLLFNFFNNLPKWMVNEVACLSTEDTDFFYATFIPFIKWYGNKINHPIVVHNDKIDQNDVHEVIKQASKNKFRFVNEYINNSNLSERETNFLLGFKKSIFGPFILYQNNKDGSLFVNDDNIYLVKGLRSPFEEIFPSRILPMFVETLLLPFEGYIISAGTYNAYQVSIGPNIKKNLKQEVKNNKIITQFIDA